MNCECIYYSKGATEEELKGLANEIDGYGYDLYPVAISRIIGKANVCEDYDGWGRKINVQDGCLVLFVQGKYHYMDSIRVGRRVFHAWFPTGAGEFAFSDIHEF